jgi:hypothetical protein
MALLLVGSWRKGMKEQLGKEILNFSEPRPFMLRFSIASTAIAVCYVGEMSFMRKRGDIIFLINNTDRRIDIGIYRRACGWFAGQ